MASPAAATPRQPVQAKPATPDNPLLPRPTPETSPTHVSAKAHDDVNPTAKSASGQSDRQQLKQDKTDKGTDFAKLIAAALSCESPAAKTFSPATGQGKLSKQANPERTATATGGTGETAAVRSASGELAAAIAGMEGKIAPQPVISGRAPAAALPAYLAAKKVAYQPGLNGQGTPKADTMLAGLRQTAAEAGQVTAAGAKAAGTSATSQARPAEVLDTQAHTQTATAEPRQAGPAQLASAGETAPFANALAAFQKARSSRMNGSVPTTVRPIQGVTGQSAATKAAAPAAQTGRSLGEAIRQGLGSRAQLVRGDPAGQANAATAGLEVDSPLAAQPDPGAPAGAALTSPQAAHAADGSLADQVVAQFRANVGRNGQEVEIQLNPPELGRVKVTLHAEGQDLRGELRVSSPETLSQLRLETPALVRQLADNGIQIQKLDISLDDQGLGQQGDWLGRQGQQQQKEGPGERPGQPDPEPSAHDGSSPGNLEETPQVAFGRDGSVNLRI